jgi:hypothetical protein
MSVIRRQPIVSSLFVAFSPGSDYATGPFICAVVMKKSASMPRSGLLAAGNWIIDQVTQEWYVPPSKTGFAGSFF